MIRHKTTFSFAIAGVLAILCLVQGCGKKDASSKTQIEKPVSSATINASQPQPVVKKKLPPPTMQDVEQAVQRVFGDDVTISSRVKPVYVIGDFNGDEFEDLAVAVQPVAAKLDAINSQVANWIIQDADKFFVPNPGVHSVRVPEIQSPHVEKDETLLAIIHGYGPSGWRNPNARQTYLVKHAAANFLGTERSFSEKYIREMKLAVQTDVIKANRDNKSGFLFWTGSNYAWHPNNG